MPNQIFKTTIPSDIIYNFLNQIYFQKTKNHIIINRTSFKKAELNNLLQLFLDEIKPYYYNSKLYYIERKLNFYKFMTIIRQICKHNQIDMFSKIRYERSSYEFDYYISYPPPAPPPSLVNTL
jgi:hypothetical protein